MSKVRGLAARGAVLALVVVCAVAALDAQTKKPAPRKPATPPPPATKTEPAMMTCPQVLGEGVRTKRQYCDVLIGRDAPASLRRHRSRGPTTWWPSSARSG